MYVHTHMYMCMCCCCCGIGPLRNCGLNKMRISVIAFALNVRTHILTHTYAFVKLHLCTYTIYMYVGVCELLRSDIFVCGRSGFGDSSKLLPAI